MCQAQPTASSVRFGHIKNMECHTAGIKNEANIGISYLLKTSSRFTPLMMMAYY
jgi:hypothetical protein